MRVFVYGSLMRGFGNHRLLEGSPFLGTAVTRPNYTMLNLGAFPGVVEWGKTPIMGELYEVDDDTLSYLDQLEGHPSFYARKVVEVIGEAGDRIEASIYVLPASWRKEQYAMIQSGDWRQPEEISHV